MLELRKKIYSKKGLAYALTYLIVFGVPGPLGLVFSSFCLRFLKLEGGWGGGGYSPESGLSKILRSGRKGRTDTHTHTHTETSAPTPAEQTQEQTQEPTCKCCTYPEKCPKLACLGRHSCLAMLEAQVFSLRKIGRRSAQSLKGAMHGLLEL